MGMMVWCALRNVDLREVPERARALEALGYDSSPRRSPSTIRSCR